MGCASAPVPATTVAPPTPTPTPVVETVPVPRTVVVGAVGLTVLDADGGVLGEVSYMEPATTAVALLTTAFEADPVISHLESDYNCSPAATLAVWDGYFTLTYDIEGRMPAGQTSYARAVAPAAPNGVGLSTPSGFGVGDPVDALISSQPGVDAPAMEIEGTAYAWVHYEVGAGVYLPDNDPNWGRDPYWGASASAVDGVITALHAPVTFVDQC